MAASTISTRDNLADRLESHITRKTGGQLRNLQVESQDDRIILRGRSRTYHLKQIAQEAAMDESGCRTLVNEIEVY